MNELDTIKGLAVAVESLIRRVENLEEDLEAARRTTQEERELDALLEELLAEPDQDEVPPNCGSG